LTAVTDLWQSLAVVELVSAADQAHQANFWCAIAIIQSYLLTYLIERDNLTSSEYLPAY